MGFAVLLLTLTTEGEDAALLPYDKIEKLLTAYIPAEQRDQKNTSSYKRSCFLSEGNPQLMQYSGLHMSVLG